MTSFWKILKQVELLLFAIFLMCTIVFFAKKTPDI